MDPVPHPKSMGGEGESDRVSRQEARTWESRGVNRLRGPGGRCEEVLPAPAAAQARGRTEGQLTGRNRAPSSGAMCMRDHLSVEFFFWQWTALSHAF